MQAVKVIAKNFINLLYPLHCLGCGKTIDPLNEFRICGRCVESIKENAMPPFELEGSFALAYSTCIYEGTLKELIHRFKFNGKAVLSKLFAKFMIHYIKKDPEILSGIDYITYVPLHKRRLKEREYNQSLLIADLISKEFALPIKNTLEKRRLTKNQNELLKKDRHINLRGAFKMLNAADVIGKGVLLIDDVMTTGATLDECAKTFFGSGAKNVTCFTLARGI